MTNYERRIIAAVVAAWDAVNESDIPGSELWSRFDVEALRQLLKESEKRDD